MNMSVVINSLCLEITLKIPLFLLLIVSTFSLVSELGAAILSIVKCLFLFEMLVSSRHFDEILGQRGFKNVKWSTILVFSFS